MQFRFISMQIFNLHKQQKRIAFFVLLLIVEFQLKIVFMFSSFFFIFTQYFYFLLYNATDFFINLCLD